MLGSAVNTLSCLYLFTLRYYIGMDDASLEQPRFELVQVQGNMKELFEGEEVLVESSDPEEDAELEKRPLYIYESWLLETARKEVYGDFFCTL